MLVNKRKQFNHRDSLNVLILAGVHGNETHAVQALYELYDIMQYNKNIHTIDFIFNVNEYGLEKDTRDNNYKEEVSTNCNRLFTRQYKTPSEIKEFLDDIKRDGYFDLILDIHNSPCCLPCVLIDYDEQADSLLGLCKNSTLYPLVRKMNKGTIKSHFNENEDCYAYTVELPVMGFNTSYKHSAGLLQTFLTDITARIVNKEIEKADASKYLTHTLISQIDNGIIYYTRQWPVGKYQEDDIICKIVNMQTDNEQFVRAPYDGILYDVDDNIYSYAGKEFGIYGRLV